MPNLVQEAAEDAEALARRLHADFNETTREVMCAIDDLSAALQRKMQALHAFKGQEERDRQGSTGRIEPSQQDAKRNESDGDN